MSLALIVTVLPGVAGSAYLLTSGVVQRTPAIAIWAAATATIMHGAFSRGALTNLGRGRVFKAGYIAVRWLHPVVFLSHALFFGLIAMAHRSDQFWMAAPLNVSTGLIVLFFGDLALLARERSWSANLEHLTDGTVPASTSGESVADRLPPPKEELA